MDSAHTHGPLGHRKCDFTNGMNSKQVISNCHDKCSEKKEKTQFYLTYLKVTHILDSQLTLSASTVTGTFKKNICSTNIKRKWNLIIKMWVFSWPAPERSVLFNITCCITFTLLLSREHRYALEHSRMGTLHKHTLSQVSSLFSNPCYRACRTGVRRHWNRNMCALKIRYLLENWGSGFALPVDQRNKQFFPLLDSLDLRATGWRVKKNISWLLLKCVYQT